MLTVAPLLLLLSTWRLGHRPRRKRVLEAAALAATLLLLLAASLTVPVARPFLVFPALAWAAVRFRQAGAAIVTLFVAAVVVWATARGRGPFVGSSLTQSLLLAQAFTGVMIATGLLLLAALTAERDQAGRLLDATFDRLPLGLVLLNSDLTLRRGSRNAEQLLGVQLHPGLAVRTLYRRLQMTDLAGHPWLAEGSEMLEATLRAGSSHGELLINRRGTAAQARLEYWAVPVHDNGRFAALAVLFHDVTELRRAEADRERLPSRLIRSQEDDRRELATRLHKDVVRGLVAALAQFDGMQQRLPASDEQAHRSVRRVVETLNHSLQATRSLLSDLRPPLLDTQGLVAAINQQLGKIAVETGMHTELHWRRDERLDPTLETTLFRAAQEALTNVVKHARATQLVVTGRSVDGLLTVEIADDGIGLAPDGQHQATVREHLGMRAMADRIELAGGSLDVRSAPDAGTTISITVPLRPRS
jgi:signal transduction histidine kinase